MVFTETKIIIFWESSAKVSKMALMSFCSMGSLVFTRSNKLKLMENRIGLTVGLVESDERWKTAYSVWLYQVKFFGLPRF